MANDGIEGFTSTKSQLEVPEDYKQEEWNFLNQGCRKCSPCQHGGSILHGLTVPFLVGGDWNMFDSSILGSSSSQLTVTHIFRGVAIPPSRCGRFAGCEPETTQISDADFIIHLSSS